MPLASAAEKRRWQRVFDADSTLVRQVKATQSAVFSQLRVLSFLLLGPMAPHGVRIDIGYLQLLAGRQLHGIPQHEGSEQQGRQGKAGQYFKRQHGRLLMSRWRRGDAAPAGHFNRVRISLLPCLQFSSPGRNFNLLL